jgi:hypothetical protein
MLVKVPADKGGGYSALLEVFHQLHCLVSFEYILLGVIRFCTSYHSAF